MKGLWVVVMVAVVGLVACGAGGAGGKEEDVKDTKDKKEGISGPSVKEVEEAFEVLALGARKYAEMRRVVDRVAGAQDTLVIERAIGIIQTVILDWREGKGGGEKDAKDSNGGGDGEGKVEATSEVAPATESGEEPEKKAAADEK